MKTHFAQSAAYNRWANARLYDAALALDDAPYRRNVGAFFKSLHGTLNHLLVTDRIWLRRLTGEGEAPNRLDAILYDDRRALALARAAEDERILRYVAGLDDRELDAAFQYANTAGTPFAAKRGDVLAHLFNHQTHHRGQIHCMLTQAGGKPHDTDLPLMPE